MTVAPVSLVALVSEPSISIVPEVEPPARFGDVAVHANWCPLGSGAIAGTTPAAGVDPAETVPTGYGGWVTAGCWLAVVVVATLVVVGAVVVVVAALVVQAHRAL